MALLPEGVGLSHARNTTQTFLCRRLAGLAHRERGFAITELMLAIAVVTVMGVYAASEYRNKMEEAAAAGAATYLDRIANAAEGHALLHFNEYANGSAVPGLSNPLRPTLAELRTAGRLPTSFPIHNGALPTRQNVEVLVDRLNCPGSGCQVRVLACTMTPLSMGGGATRFDLASTVVQNLNGRGAQSLQGSGGILRGGTLTMANPYGTIEGIVCATSSIDTALYERFVRIGDTRDPNLQGPLTVAGPTTINNTLSTTGDTSTGNCARILAATGRAGFGCAHPNDVPAGWTGGVRAPDAVANRVLASDNPAGFTGSNGNYAYMGVSGGVAEVRTSGRAAADRLTPTGSYAPGSACSAADEGALARNANASGLVTCLSGTWRSLGTRANAGDACSPDGSVATSSTDIQLVCVGGRYLGMNEIVRPGRAGNACSSPGVTAIDTSNNNATLVCRRSPNGVMRLHNINDVTTNLSFVRSLDVFADDVVPKPTTCLPASGVAATPIIQVIGKSYASESGEVNVYSADTGSGWQIKMTDSDGVMLSGSTSATGARPVATAYVYCFYPWASSVRSTEAKVRSP